MAEPLTESEREALVYICHVRGEGTEWAESMLAYEDTVQAVEDERDALAERVELLRAALERAAVAIQSLRADNEAAS